MPCANAEVMDARASRPAMALVVMTDVFVFISPFFVYWPRMPLPENPQPYLTQTCVVVYLPFSKPGDVNIPMLTHPRKFPSTIVRFCVTFWLTAFHLPGKSVRAAKIHAAALAQGLKFSLKNIHLLYTPPLLVNGSMRLSRNNLHKTAQNFVRIFAKMLSAVHANDSDNPKPLIFSPHRSSKRDIHGGGYGNILGNVGSQQREHHAYAGMRYGLHNVCAALAP